MAWEPHPHRVAAASGIHAVQTDLKLGYFQRHALQMQQNHIQLMHVFFAMSHTQTLPKIRSGNMRSVEALPTLFRHLISYFHEVVVANHL